MSPTWSHSRLAEADADTTKIKEPGTAKVLDLGESDDEEFEDLIEDFPTQPDLRQVLQNSIQSFRIRSIRF